MWFRWKYTKLIGHLACFNNEVSILAVDNYQKCLDVADGVPHTSGIDAPTTSGWICVAQDSHISLLRDKALGAPSATCMLWYVHPWN